MNAVIIEVGMTALADIKEQTPRPGYIKVKIVALGVDSMDLDHTTGTGCVGKILGCDLFNIVEEVGEEYKSTAKKRRSGLCSDPWSQFGTHR